jgi:DNA-binding CsgD family transcriptional regulator
MNTAALKADVSKAAASIAQSRSHEDLLASLRHVAGVFGASHGYLSLRRALRFSDGHLLRVTTYGSDMMDSYMDRRMYEYDPVLNHLRGSTRATGYDDLDWSSPNARDVRHMKSTFGIGPSGLGVSVFGPCGTWGIITLSAANEAAPWSEWKEEAACMFGCLGTMFFERMKALHAAGTVRRGVLSPREIETLVWTARGKTIAETALILDLAPTTVRHVIDSARKKLGAATKSEAVAKAVFLRLIEFH